MSKEKLFLEDELKVLVKEAVDNFIQDTLYEEEEEVVEEADKDDDEEDKEEDSDEEDDEELNEAWSVKAANSEKGNKKSDDLKVDNLRELQKLARTGTYDYFHVVKPNGDEVEYIVEKGKLVEM